MLYIKYYLLGEGNLKAVVFRVKINRKVNVCKKI